MSPAPDVPPAARSDHDRQRKLLRGVSTLERRTFRTAVGWLFLYIENDPRGGRTVQEGVLWRIASRVGRVSDHCFRRAAIPLSQRTWPSIQPASTQPPANLGPKVRSLPHSEAG